MSRALFFFIFFVNIIYSQGPCASNNEVSIDFGTTALTGSWPTGVTGHDLWTSNPTGTNSAAIVKTSSGFSASWNTKTDHTNPGTGAYLISNSAWNDFSGNAMSNNILYITRSVCPYTDYTFSFWGMNILKTGQCGGSVERDIIQVKVYKSDLSVLSSSATTTYAVNGSWAQQTYSFNSGANTTLHIAIVNTTGNELWTGCGSDFCIDDIKLYRCNNTALSFSSTGSAAPTCGLSNGTVTATPSGGSTQYTYSWNSSPAQTTQTATALAPGTYTVTVSEAAACSTTPITTNVTIANVGTTPVATAKSNDSYCKDSIVPITTFSSTPVGSTYTWTNSNTSIGLAASGSGSIASYTSTNAGETTLTGTISVTPTLTGCVGSAISFVRTAFPHNNPSCVTSLAIELTSFDVLENNQKTIDITWTTSLEYKNDYYTIEKSNDGINWNLYRKINGKGNTSEESEYSIQDQNPHHGISYYRLEAVDLDGVRTNSEIRVLNLKKEDCQLTVENINSENIQVKSNDPKMIFSIVTNDGKTLYEGNSEGVTNLNLKSGYYILNFECNGEKQHYNFYH